MSSVLDVCVNEEQVHLRVDVLHHNLEAVEASSFSSLDLVGEAFNKLFIDDAVDRKSVCRERVCLAV